VRFLKIKLLKIIISREYILREEDGHSFLLCPAGFALAQLASALLIPRNLTLKDPSLWTLTVPYVHATTLMHFPFGFGDRESAPSTAGQPEDPCPTLRLCLLHQVKLTNLKSHQNIFLVSEYLTPFICMFIISFNNEYKNIVRLQVICDAHCTFPFYKVLSTLQKTFNYFKEYTVCLLWISLAINHSFLYIC